MTSVRYLQARSLAQSPRRPRLRGDPSLRTRRSCVIRRSCVVNVPLRNGSPTWWKFAVPSEVRDALEYAWRFRIEAHVAAHADASVDTVDSLKNYCLFVDALARARIIVPLGSDRPRNAPYVVAESVPTLTVHSATRIAVVS